MTSFISDRRGSMGLGFYIMTSIVGLVALSLISILIFVINSAFFVEFNASGFADADTEKVEDGIMGSIKMMDWIMVLLLVFSLVGAGIYGYQNPESVVNFLLVFLLAPFLGFVSYMFNHIFYQIIMQSAFASAVNYFPNMIIICTNLHWVALGMLIVGCYSIYAASRGGIPR